MLYPRSGSLSPSPFLSAPWSSYFFKTPSWCFEYLFCFVFFNLKTRELWDHHFPCLDSPVSLAVLILLSPTQDALTAICRADRWQGHCRAPPLLAVPAHILIVCSRRFLETGETTTRNPLKTGLWNKRAPWSSPLGHGTSGFSIYRWPLTVSLHTWKPDAARGPISECWINTG